MQRRAMVWTNFSYILTLLRNLWDERERKHTHNIYLTALQVDAKRITNVKLTAGVTCTCRRLKRTGKCMSVTNPNTIVRWCAHCLMVNEWRSTCTICMEEDNKKIASRNFYLSYVCFVCCRGSISSPPPPPFYGIFFISTASVCSLLKCLESRNFQLMYVIHEVWGYALQHYRIHTIHPSTWT